MTHGHADCTGCGHEWELRKPYPEIDVVRCSECGATDDAITVTGTPPKTTDPDDLPLDERLRFEEQRVAVRNRARRLMDQIEQLGDGLGPEELEPMYMALDMLVAELASDKVRSPDEVDRAATFLAEKEDELESHDVVAEISGSNSGLRS